MSNIKYTTDGKKVVVIGSLNSQEKIVQEVFIVGGSEIPSGEHFVVKSLHDEPAVSWKEKNLKDLELRYETESKKTLSAIDQLDRRWTIQRKLLEGKIEWAAKAIKEISPEMFETLLNWINGDIKYLVKVGYEPELIEWNTLLESYSDGLRLVSIFGRTKGDFTYAIGDYSDYSGGKTHYKPFKNYNDAFEFFKSEVLKKDITDGIFKISTEYNIDLDSEKMDVFLSKKTQTLNKNISDYSKSIEIWEKSLKEINAKKK